MSNVSVQTRPAAALRLPFLNLLPLLFTLLLSLLPAVGFAQDWAGIDAANDKKDYKTAENILAGLKATQEKNADWLWRMARAEYNRGIQSPEKDPKYSKGMYAGLDYAKKALAADPNNGDAHSWYAILIGKVGILEGTESKIKKAYEVKDHAMKAIKLNPKDDTNYHIMGRWHYELASLSWVERKLASALFATPPVGTFPESIQYLSKARDLDPIDIQHYYWLARAQHANGNDADAINTLKKAVTLKPRDGAEKMLLDDSKKLLAELQ